MGSGPFSGSLLCRCEYMICAGRYRMRGCKYMMCAGLDVSIECVQVGLECVDVEA